jgi:2'-5' RNA ligase
MRLFIGVAPPDDLRAEVAALTGPMRDVAPRLKWVDPALYHLTLQFLGEIDEDKKAALAGALPELSAREPFRIQLGNLMTLPRGNRARVIALSVAEGFAELESLARAVFRLTKSKRIPRERRPFKAHLTLARSRRGENIPAVLELENVILPALPAWDVDALHLFQSILRPSGPVYQSRLSVGLMGR